MYSDSLLLQWFKMFPFIPNAGVTIKMMYTTEIHICDRMYFSCTFSCVSCVIVLRLVAMHQFSIVPTKPPWSFHITSRILWRTLCEYKLKSDIFSYYLSPANKKHLDWFWIKRYEAQELRQTIWKLNEIMVDLMDFNRRRRCRWVTEVFILVKTFFVFSFRLLDGI